MGSPLGRCRSSKCVGDAAELMASPSSCRKASRCEVATLRCSCFRCEQKCVSLGQRRLATGDELPILLFGSRRPLLADGWPVEILRDC